MNEEWSFEREDAESWEQYFFVLKKEAIEAGREWAKKEGLDWFCVGRGENVQIPTKPDIEDIFDGLDEQYYCNCGNPDADCAPFDESCRKENEAARERLEEKISKALKESMKEAEAMVNLIVYIIGKSPKRNKIKIVRPLIEIEENTEWHDAMKKCVEMLAGCDAIIMCGEWEKSRGCAQEYWKAVDAGIVIFRFEDVVR